MQILERQTESLFAGDVIYYLENPKRINCKSGELDQIQGQYINISIAFFYINSNSLRGYNRKNAICNVKKTPTLNIYKIPRDTPNNDNIFKNYM